MIRVFYSPQVNEKNILTYQIEGEIITATLSERPVPPKPIVLPPDGEETLPEETTPEPVVITDVFDFSSFPNGIAKAIITPLPGNPFVNVHREDGILYVELLNYITEDASEFEKFPVWIEVE